MKNEENKQAQTNEVNQWATPAETPMDSSTASFDDPLDTDVDPNDAAYPMLSPGIYDFIISDAKSEQPTKNNDGLMVRFKLKTVSPQIAYKTGNTIQPGLVLNDNIVYTPMGNLTMAMIKQRLAQLALAVGFHGKYGELVNNSAAILNGKAVRVKVKVDKATTDFPERNSVSAYVVPSKRAD